jgi:hypothetical protein
MYYTSRALRGAELGYPKIEKLAFALVTSARQLCPYYRAHPMKVLTSHPLKKALHKMDSFGRVVQWSVELGEFDIEYVPKTAIRGHAMADFLGQLTEDVEVVSDKLAGLTWMVDVDGSSNKDGSKAEIVLTASHGLIFEHAICFEVDATNNEAEYEALITGMTTVRRLSATNINV